VVGSSDGLVEIWSTVSRYQELKLDLPYQQNEEFLGHDDTKIKAMTVSNDGTLLATGDSQGTIKVWRLDNGNCLRDIKAYSKDSSLLYLNFSPEATHLLTTASSGTIVREYGLRTGRLLKEFHGHASFVNVCRYYTIISSLEDDDYDHDDVVVRVLTGSADGTARIWDSKTSELLHILRPYSHGLSRTTIGMCLFQCPSGGVHISDEMGSPNLHTILPLESSSNIMILVPRGPRAFIVNLTSGVVVQTIDSTDGSSWVAATVSPSNDEWLYVVSDRGALVIFNWKTGQEETTLPNFAHDTTGYNNCEITAIIHHPFKGMLAAYSQDTTVKRGRLAIWK
jgi:WD40 repeat-containing protein SMU1